MTLIFTENVRAWRKFDYFVIISVISSINTINARWLFFPSHLSQAKEQGFKVIVDPSRVEQDDETDTFSVNFRALCNLKKSMDLIDFDIAFQRVYPGQIIKLWARKTEKAIATVYLTLKC